MPRHTRRGLLAAAGTAASAALAGCPYGTFPGEQPAGSGNDTEGQDEPLEGEDTGELAATIEVAPNGEPVFRPESVQIENGDSVRWIWRTEGYNILPQQVPAGANWQGVPFVQESGETYTHTFEVTGTYVYASEPVDELDMVGEIAVLA